MRKYPILFASLALLLAVGACTYTQKIQDGTMAADRKQYSVAVDMLQKEYRKSKSRVERGKLAMLLGESYKNINKSDESIEWYKTAYDNQAGVDALKEYAYALKKAERYKEAMQAFKDLGIEIGSPYEYRREILSCETAIGWKGIKRVEYEAALTDFNTGYAEYSPVLYRDRQLVFTSDRKAGKDADTYAWTGNAFSDLYTVDLGSNTVTPFDARLNTDDNEGTAAFSQEYGEMFFTRCIGPKNEDAYCKLMVSERLEDGWSVPRTLDFVREGINYSSPSLSADGQDLYFSCDHPDGWGGWDIWVAHRLANGEWGEPELMSRSINTLGNEKFPFIDADTLYFSSDWHTGMGGLDIFRTYKMRNGAWAPVFNLKPPINSGGDDFGFIVDHLNPLPKGALQQGYFTSTRNEGIGNDDIYRFEKRVLPPEPVPPKPVDVVYKMVLDGYVLEKIYQDPSNPNSKVLGRKPLPASNVEITIGKEKRTVQVGEDGMFTLDLNENTDYDFLANHPGYLANTAKFSTKGIGRDPDNPELHFEVEIVLNKIFLNREIRLENIYYDYDQWNIREDAKPTLDELARNLELNPEIRIELASHTDCRGTTKYNEDLSQKRAQSAVDYLITKGIDASRLSARGYGESVPEADCLCARCTEEEHQLNRRTTFKITQ